jgi:hypothetical protein
MVSTALRFALALKFHVHDERSVTENQQRKAISETWWSLYCLESILSSITGRPCMLRNEDITAPLPSDFAATGGKDNSTTSRTMSYEDANVQLATLTQRVSSKLYTERRVTRAWTQIQASITSLLLELDDWALEAMPEHLQGADATPEVQHQQLLLKKQYYRLRLLITRPCLCRFEQCHDLNTGIHTSLDRALAELCIQTAQDEVSLLPDPIDLKLLYEKGPWWTVVHNCMFPSLLSIS